ncbi:gephyrin-like molybdotransferase Glp [Thermoactinomyces sp. CICC 10522]|uniref:molybdopterin molybdotransferase MoeA n=1 Tax=Thermoactinomyces sp. CICC 10522 TaxID=2767427 RepID=UPI0018DB99E8|nr:molybdopterin molybdotransferase MoeA [Thermoactinomyces sp. CICC 10522]
MRFQREIVKVKEARARLLPHINELDTEILPLSQCHGRTLAEEITAPIPLPHFRRSSMDGFAIQARATKGATKENPVWLKVLETIPCGNVPRCEITDTTASRIMTGAAVPDSADAVVMLEMTQTAVKNGETYVGVEREIAPGTNVAAIGEELEQGTLLLHKGRRIGPGEIALLATFGHAQVKVYRKPRVAIFATGSELLEADAPLEPGKIRNSNSYMLYSLLLDCGAEPLMQPILPDDVSQAQTAILQATETADLVITTGGVSVGDYDILVDIFERWDGQMLFNKLAMRPGSPTTVGVRNNRFLFALSGNPGACFVGFELFVRPVILGMMGKTEFDLPLITASMAVDFTKPSGFERYVRGIYQIEDGRVYVRPAGLEKSSVTLTIRDTNCLIIVPPGGRGVKKGDQVQVLMLKKLE